MSAEAEHAAWSAATAAGSWLSSALYYAEFWHQNAINGEQYGFSYDDDVGQSSDISVTNPQYMVAAVGW